MEKTIGIMHICASIFWQKSASFGILSPTLGGIIAPPGPSVIA
jgi:hypothetical protein